MRSSVFTTAIQHDKVQQPVLIEVNRHTAIIPRRTGIRHTFGIQSQKVVIDALDTVISIDVFLYDG